MAEKPLKSLKFHGLDDIYTIPTGGNIEIEFEGEPTGTPSGIDADSLGGILAEDFATKNFVSSEIAKAKLDGADQNVDLSGYATKDELRLTAEQVGAATSESVNTAKAEVTSYVNEQVKKAAPRNLLDNSDFRNPVAQVGFDELHGTDRYVIDRWKRLYDIGTVTKMNDGIKISGGTTECYINQKIDLRGLVGKTLTMAVQSNDEDWKLCGSVVLQENTDAQVFAAENGLYLMTNGGGFTIRVIAGHEYTIKWVALYEGEYTIDTLPEYQPKGYGAELAECQRYFQRISNPCLTGIVTVMDMVNFYCPLCTPLRLCGAIEEPTVTFEDYGWINVDGNSITPTGVQDYYKIGYHGLHITLTADGITDLVGTSVPAVLNMPIFIVSCDL